MEANTILNADILDILFEGKNKDYGVYELRKAYNKRIGMALAFVIVVCFVFFFTQLFAKVDTSAKPIPIIELDLQRVKEIEEKNRLPSPCYPLDYRSLK